MTTNTKDAQNKKFKEVYDKYNTYVIKLAHMYCKHTDDVYDVSQDAFLKIFVNIDDIYEIEFPAVKLYIRKLVVRTAIDKQRKKKVSPSKSIFDEDIDYNIDRSLETRYIVHSVEDIAISEAECDNIFSIIEAMPHKYAAVLIHKIYGYSNAEMASKFGTTPGNIGVRLNRARKLLLAALNS